MSPELDAVECQRVAGLLHAAQLDEGVGGPLVARDAAVCHRVAAVKLGAAASHQGVEEGAQVVLWQVMG